MPHISAGMSSASARSPIASTQPRVGAGAALVARHVEARRMRARRRRAARRGRECRTGRPMRGESRPAPRTTAASGPVGRLDALDLPGAEPDHAACRPSAPARSRRACRSRRRPRSRTSAARTTSALRASPSPVGSATSTNAFASARSSRAGSRRSSRRPPWRRGRLPPSPRRGRRRPAPPPRSATSRPTSAAAAVGCVAGADRPRTARVEALPCLHRERDARVAEHGADHHQARAGQREPDADVLAGPVALGHGGRVVDDLRAPPR